MKKILFTLLLLILFIPSVKAETISITPQLNYYEEDVQTFSNKTLYGGKYWGVFTGYEQYFTTARFSFDYNFPAAGDVYNVYFWMVAEGLTPIFSLNDIPCTVVPSYYNQSGVNTGLNMVACLNIPYSNNFTVILKGAWPGSHNGEHFGLNNTVTINRFETSDTALKEGIDTVNSTMQQTNESIQQGNEKLDDLNDNITSSDTSQSENQANSFFEGFESNDYGLSDIITMPLDLIRGLTNNSCVALSLTIPFVNKTFELPCMSSIYSRHFGSFFTIYQTVTFGFVAYWVVVKIFALVKSFKDPNDDKIEVVDL